MANNRFVLSVGLFLGLIVAACQPAAPSAPAPAPKAGDKPAATAATPAAPTAAAAATEKPAAQSPTATAAAKPSAQTDVTLALSWLRNGQYMAVLAADAKGYFAEEGIKLRLIDGGPGKNPVPIVGAGQAQFGSGSGAAVFQARTAPDPVDVVAIGVLLQKFPYAYITLANPGDPEPKPKDIEGKVFGMQADGDFWLKAFAQKNDVDLSKVKVETVQANAEPLLVGKVDFFTGLVTNQTYQLEQEIAKPDAAPNLKGKVWKAMLFSQHGVPSYSDALFATSRTIKENPDLVRGFLRAVARGMQLTLENPDEAVRLVAEYPEQVEDVAKLAWRLKIQSELAVSEDTQKNGLLWMNPQVWEQTMAFYKEYDQIPRVLPVAEMMTNEFNPGPGLKP